MKADKIIGAVQAVTGKWAKQRKAEERHASAELNRRYAMTRCRTVTIRDAAFATMEDAYLKASAQGTLPAHARQVMYAARGYIQKHADRELGGGFDQYFTQQLLPEYIEHSGASWNVVYDARGNFVEPHGRIRVPLGTLQVREYLGRIEGHTVKPPRFDIREGGYPTLGPNNRFGAILFIEKEGFAPLFEAVKLAERYDIAVMSTKGMSVTASRQLVEYLCGLGPPLLVVHDFDKAGFSIVGTLRRSTRRYQFHHGHAANVIDLGLRLEDVDDLETEDVHIESPAKARWNLHENGASPEEIDFLLERRVELNAFASDALVAWIEGKLQQHGVVKVIPDGQTLADAYARMRKQALVQGRIQEVLPEVAGGAASAPDDLAAQVTRRLKKNRALPWDAAVRAIAEADHRRSKP